MKFSLRFMLISLCLLGAFVGMMGNWLIRSPETFFVAIQICSTILPFALAIGTIVWLGLRAPRRRGLVLWGVFLLLMPALVQLPVALIFPSRDPLRVLGNKRLIETRLPNQVDQPWIWRELARRLADGNLAQEEVDAALAPLVNMMKTTRPQGWNQPLPWQRDFLKAAVAANVISKEMKIELADAYFGSSPVVQATKYPRPRGAPGIQLNVQFGNPWGDNQQFGVELLWNVSKVSIGEKPLSLRQVQRVHQNWIGYSDLNLEPGEYEIAVDIELAYVDPFALTGSNASALPFDQWPPALRRWTKTVTVPVTVEGRD
jgi:hypothetical protein